MSNDTVAESSVLKYGFVSLFARGEDCAKIVCLPVLAKCSAALQPGGVLNVYLLSSVR